MKIWEPGRSTRFILQARRRGVSVGATWSAYGDHWFLTEAAATAECAALNTSTREVRVLRVDTTVTPVSPSGGPYQEES